MADPVVVDASAIADLLQGGRLGEAVAGRLQGAALHGPALLDAEVLSALGRTHRAGEPASAAGQERLRLLAALPIGRHPVGDLVLGAWSRRDRVRLVDAVHLELAERSDAPLVTTDRRLRLEPRVEVVGPPRSTDA